MFVHLDEEDLSNALESKNQVCRSKTTLLLNPIKGRMSFDGEKERQDEEFQNN